MLAKVSNIGIFFLFINQIKANYFQVYIIEILMFGHHVLSTYNVFPRS